MFALDEFETPNDHYAWHANLSYLFDRNENGKLYIVKSIEDDLSYHQSR